MVITFSVALPPQSGGIWGLHPGLHKLYQRGELTGCCVEFEYANPLAGATITTIRASQRQVAQLDSALDEFRGRDSQPVQEPVSTH